MVVWQHGLPWDLFPRLTEEEVEFNMEMQKLRGPVPSWERTQCTVNDREADSVEDKSDRRTPTGVPTEAYTAIHILKAPISLIPVTIRRRPNVCSSIYSHRLYAPKSEHLESARLTDTDSSEIREESDVRCMSLSVHRDWMEEEEDEHETSSSAPKATGQMRYRRLGEHPIIKNVRHMCKVVQTRCQRIFGTMQKIHMNRRQRRQEHTSTEATMTHLNNEVLAAGLRSCIAQKKSCNVTEGKRKRITFMDNIHTQTAMKQRK